MKKYDRQTRLPEVGEEGQRQLARASVLCVGAGGLGSSALLYLAAAGVGHIGIIDFDNVDESNLQRQIIFDARSGGRKKTSAAEERLLALNPDTHVTTYDARLDSRNAGKIFPNYDVIIDGTDNFTAKFLINDAARKYSKPWVYGAIQGYDGQVAVFDTSGPCYRCLYPAPPKAAIANCAENGVLGPVAGMIGTAQALQTLLLLLGHEKFSPLRGKLWLIDCMSMATRELHIPRAKNCKICGIAPESIVLENETAAACAAVPQVSPEQARKLARAVFIDVRESPELAAGMIPNALHLPLSALRAGLAEKPQLAADTPVVLYCQRGQRSLAAAPIVQDMGFTAVLSLAGGYGAWKKQP
ncbi:MAG TPA: ThiF family adenylyltransferase [Alphaproteobacteria bacterium]|nr:ThiF family adenylyltransferase [Alphaproteobacteria bacterium]